MTFGIIVSTRAFFPGSLALTARGIVERRMAALGHDIVMIEESAVKYGAIESYDDALKCAELFKANRERIDGVVVVLPNFGDEVGVSSTLALAQLNVPVLVVAADDSLDALDLAHRRDAFCGKLSVCANLNQNGIPFTNTTTHTLPLDSAQFDAEIDRFSRICAVVRGMRGARIGAIGTRPDPFRTTRYSEKLLQKSGITTCVIDMSDMEANAAAYDDNDPVVVENVARIRAYGNPNADATDEKLIKNAKLLAAVEAWVKKMHINAFALQCWDSLEWHFGCAACLTMSMLGESGVPAACEMDVMGAVTMLAMSLAAGSPAGYLDWNNNYADDRDKCICLHCSNFPKSFMQNEQPEIGSLDVLSTTIEKDLCFGACKGRVAAGPFTFAKVTTDDFTGKVKFYTGHGEFTDDPAWTPGGFAVCHVPGLQDLMHYMAKNGFEHHVCMGRGNVADILMEALGNYLGWEGYCHG